MRLFLRGVRFLKCRTDIKRVMAAPCSSVTSGRKHINGVDLYYEQTGRGKHAVLLIPGTLGSVGTDFGPQMKSLNKERFTVVGWDPRGYGKSRPPARDFPLDYLERDAKDAVDLMKALGFDKFSVLGWSGGGVAAMIAAAKNPDVISKMVLSATIAYISQLDLELHEAMHAARKPNAQMEEIYGAEGLVKSWDAYMETIRQFAKRPGGNVCLELLPLISCPTLIIHGQKDTLVSIDNPHLIHENIKGSRLHLMLEGGHDLHLQYADEFNKLVEDFLEE